MSNEASAGRRFSVNRHCPGCAAPALTRRGFLERSSMGFGWLAFAGLAGRWAAAEVQAAATHFAPRAKHVIFLFMDGGVSHVDTFDPKPELAKHNGESAVWRSVTGSQAESAGRKWLQSLWEFKQHGQSGLWVSDLLPHIAGVADELCVIRSLVGESPLHGAQNLLLHTGRSIGAAPSIGAWISYGLGTENEQLPGYVLLNNDWTPNGGFQNFSSAWLPATHQATMVRAKGTPVDNIVPADAADVQRAKLDFLSEQDMAAAAVRGGSAEIEAAVRNYEIAAQMQSLVPDLCDVKDESEATLKLYGVDRENDYERFYSLQCLRARRMVEAGVRFIEVTCPLTHTNNAPWDQHGDLKRRHEENARITDQPVAALISDLKSRGLLDETLVLWAGEMGRTPHSSGTDGRDHHVSGYTVWLAGGGVRGGMTYGATDEMGMAAVENPIDIHDLHATVLHQLGVDHEKLTFRFGGRDMRLTDVRGKVIKEVIS
jgi:Protein of unknown function (DUF1501)